MANVTFSPAQTKKCPFCAETIQSRAIKCRFCGEFLNTDKAKALEDSPEANGDSAQNEELPDGILFQGRPSLWGLLPAIFKGLVLFGVAIVLARVPLERIATSLLNLKLTEAYLLTFGRYRVIGALGLAVAVMLFLLLKMVRLKTIYYEVTPARIEWGRGIFDRKVDNLDMFRVLDLKLRRSILDCVFGIGTVVLVTSDKSDPEFTFEKVRDPRSLYDVIKKASLDADRRSNVVHLE